MRGHRDEILKLEADLRQQRRDRAQTNTPKPVPNREFVNDRAKLILHRLVARSLRANPALLEDARTRLQSLAEPAPDYVTHGARVLDRPAEDVANLIGSRSEHITHLRVSLAFRLPEGFDDEAWRRRVW